MSLHRLNPTPLDAAPKIDSGVRAYRSDVRSSGRAALFLDRDGVVIEDKHYLRSPADVTLVAGAVDLLRWAGRRGMPVAVVTNQSGIARGLLDWTDFEAVEAEIAKQLQAQAVAVDMVVACPFHPDFTPGYGARHSYWRKPGPGMLLAAGEALGLDLSASWMIGDKQSDVDAARAAGLAGALLVRPNGGPSDGGALDVVGSPSFSTAEVTTLMEALALLECRIT